jgi:hypothetical protein
MRFKKNDGGRELAGYKGKHVGDCVPRAIAIALGLKYRALRKELDDLNREMTGGLGQSTQNGTALPVSHKYLTDRGWELVLTKGQYLKDIPQEGIYIACLARHDCAVIDGVVLDTWDSRVSRRTKCKSPSMKGYYQQESQS